MSDILTYIKQFESEDSPYIEVNYEEGRKAKDRTDYILYYDSNILIRSNSMIYASRENVIYKDDKSKQWVLSSLISLIEDKDINKLRLGRISTKANSVMKNILAFSEVHDTESTTIHTIRYVYVTDDKLIFRYSFLSDNIQALTIVGKYIEMIENELPEVNTFKERGTY